MTSANSRWAATGSYDATIIISDLRSGSISQEWFIQTAHDDINAPLPGAMGAPHSPDLNFLAFSPDSRYLASTGLIPGVTVWDLHQNASKVVSLGVDNFYGTVRRCAWSPDGSSILAELTNNTLHIWEASGTFQRRHPD